MSKLIEMLERHEGLRLKPYKCTANKHTVFIGRNYEDNPFTTDELTLILSKGCTKEVAYEICSNDVRRIKKELVKRLDFFSTLDEVRQAALIDMAFQMGVGGLLGFKKMIEASRQKDWLMACLHAKDSMWGRTFINRSTEILKMLETGQWQF